jgi:hypothetical protein
MTVLLEIFVALSLAMPSGVGLLKTVELAVWNISSCIPRYSNKFQHVHWLRVRKRGHLIVPSFESSDVTIIVSRSFIRRRGMSRSGFRRVDEERKWTRNCVSGGFAWRLGVYKCERDIMGGSAVA